MNFRENKQRGFTIIELIATIAILSFGILGVYSAFTPFIALNSNISYRLTASYLAQDGLEIIRNIRDNNFVAGRPWSQGLLSCSFGCQADYKTGTSGETPANQLQSYGAGNFLNLNSDGFYSYDAGTPTKFKRQITIAQVSTDVLHVYVQIFWDYNGQSYTFDTKEYLYNWH